MKALTVIELSQVSGGICSEFYDADIPLNYLPIVAKHLKLLNQHKFDPDAMLQELSDSGLDPRFVTVNVGVYCTPHLNG